jgi:hypothetical protein
MKFAAAMISLAGLASGLGINCNGSGLCGSSSANMQRIANIIRGDGVSPGIPDNRFYNNGEHIWCAPSVDFWTCAFLQKSGGAPGSSIKTLIQELADHGCYTCGSIPLFYPNDNNVNDGE